MRDVTPIVRLIMRPALSRSRATLTPLGVHANINF